VHKGRNAPFFFLKSISVYDMKFNYFISMDASVVAAVYGDLAFIIVGNKISLGVVSNLADFYHQMVESDMSVFVTELTKLGLNDNSSQIKELYFGLCQASIVKVS
jgi:hypothetical protein